MLETTYINYLSEEIEGHGFFRLSPEEFTDEETVARELADETGEAKAEKRFSAEIISIGNSATRPQLVESKDLSLAS